MASKPAALPDSSSATMFVTELEVSLAEAKKRIAQLEKSNQNLRADVGKLSGFPMIYPFLQVGFISLLMDMLYVQLQVRLIFG